jgi:hypothetical protein
MGIILLILFILILIAPELLILAGSFVMLFLYGVGEFILRLCGRSFNDKK